MIYKKSHRLSTHITFWIAMIIISLAATLSLVVGLYSRSVLKDKVQHELDETAFHMADKMDQFMWSRSGELYTLAALKPLKSLETPSETEALLNSLKSNFPSFSWIGVTDLNGKVIAATDGILKDADISERPVFVNGIKGEFIGDVHDAVLLQNLLPNPSGEPMKFVDISFPLTDVSGEKIGVLAAHLSWAWAHEVEDTLMTPLKLQHQVEIFVVSANDGTVLLGPETSIGKVYKSNPKKYIEAVSVADGYLGYKGLNWSIYVRQSESTALKSINQIQWITWGIGGGFALLFLMLGRRASKIVAKPIAALIHALDQVRFGESPVLPEGKGILEIEKLTDTLYELFDTLHVNIKTIDTLENAANSDNLTGLPNRAALKQFWDSTTRHYKQLYVLSMDLDGFKQINDTYGHAAGDFVLTEVANRLKATVRDRELVARIGGDEFVIVLIPNDSPLDTGALVARRIIDVIGRPFIYEAFSLTIGCSVGGAIWHGDGDLQSVLELSDKALYKAKNGGKNRYEYLES